ncbi:MAG: multi-sensor hybrid histidine kinase [Verrucomicrobia bacterium]|nr:multi-sensor hybrid histidine kinase [Verrucomicrobiota bacterium]
MSLPIKILIAEDNPDDAELALVELRRAGFEPEWERVETEAEFAARLDGKLDLILSDFQMPEFNGLRALELLKQSGLDVPFILISGTIGEEIAVKAMKHGAADYFLKDRLTRLGAAVSHAIAETRLRRERHDAAEALRLAQAQLGQLLEHSPAVLYVLKLDGDHVTPHVVSENIITLLGFPVAEALSFKWWLGQVHPDDRDLAAASLVQTRQAGASLTEYRMRHKDGSYRWVDDARRLIRNDAGEPVELIGVLTDITERKRAAEIVAQASGTAARDRRQQMRLELGALATATLAMYVLAARFNWFESITSWFLAHEYNQMDEMILAALTFGAGLGIFGFRRWRESELDLTNHHQVQAALSRLHEEMDRRVQQRTAELKNANQSLVGEIAEHKETETRLTESNRRFHEMLENVDLIAMTLDMKGRVTFCNDYLLALSGWRREDILGCDWCGKFLPESAAAVKEMFFSKVEAIPAHHENPIRIRSGELRDIVWNNTMLRDAKGNVVGTASIGEDVTVRKRAGRILQESEERFRELAENIREVFWITDLATHEKLYVSPAYEIVWGRTCTSLYAAPQSWLEAVRPEDRARVERARDSHPDTFAEEYRILRPDGEERWIRDRAFAVKEPDGSIKRCVGVAEDITESKKLQEQFFRAQRMEAIGTLAGGIAHDLNNILAPILMAPALLRENARTEQDRRLLNVIEQSAKRGSNVVRQLLTFSRGTGGDRVEVQLPSLLAEMGEIMRETFPRDIMIEINAPPDLRPVVGDPTQLHQVIMNLCVNARDAMPGGGTLSLNVKNVELTAEEVRTHSPAQAGSHVALSITDTGEGISPAIMDRIFDPFFTTKPPTKGTGLGLSTVLGIVRSHQGYTTVASTVGSGTTFTIYLPAAAVDTRLPAPPKAEDLAGGHGELILVVDDEEPILAATRLMLEHYGYRVETAGNGAEALAAFVANREAIKVVITDVMMPVMGGVTLIRALRALAPKLKVLATSGLTDQENDAQLKAAGVNGIIAKPCNPLELLEAIRAQLVEHIVYPAPVEVSNALA